MSTVIRGEVDDMMASPCGSRYIPIYGADDLGRLSGLKKDMGQLLSRYGFTDKASSELADEIVGVAMARGRNDEDARMVIPKPDDVPVGIWVE